MDVRREHFHRERALQERTRALNIWVSWWPHDPAASELHPVYDESGEAAYRAPRRIPALWWFDEEGGDQLTAEGRTLYRRGNFGFAASEFMNVGLLPDPDERLNDMIQWDGWFWEVIEFDLTSASVSPGEGHQRSGGASIRVAVKRRYPETDMPFDTFPEWEAPQAPVFDDGGTAPGADGQILDGGGAGSTF